jgi:transcription elongation factor Elf1
MKKHPRIRELQLGKTVKEFVDELLKNGDYDFQRLDDSELLEKIVKKLVEIDDPNVRFGVFFKESCAYIESINYESFDIPVDYYDNEWGGYLENESWTDCQLLNQIVEELFGPRKKQKSAKFTKAQLLKQQGKVNSNPRSGACPHCGKKEIVFLDDFKTDETAQELGCKSCGLTWKLYYEKKLKSVVR